MILMYNGAAHAAIGHQNSLFEKLVSTFSRVLSSATCKGSNIRFCQMMDANIQKVMGQNDS